MEIDGILDELGNSLGEEGKNTIISFRDYLEALRQRPQKNLRDIFQLVYDMVHYYVPEGTDENPSDPENIKFVRYDFSEFLVNGTDSPFFADRLFANRFMNLINSFNQVPDWHKIYLFEGPPGSGKSTFLNRFLARFENYMESDEGEHYETFWKIDRHLFKGGKRKDREPADAADCGEAEGGPDGDAFYDKERYLQVPCPNHDHPTAQIPKAYRKQLLWEVIEDEDFKRRLFGEKKYKWIFKEEPCTICASLFEAILEKVGSPIAALGMLHPRRMRFNRRLGEGISVYNPGDAYRRSAVLNPVLQAAIDDMLSDSNLVKYVHSSLAQTNNGIYALMDIKNYNRLRILHLHGIISDGIHKVQTIEERIKSLFLGLINPQDKEFIDSKRSLLDRSVHIRMPYVLDYNTEVQIYKNRFGANIGDMFLPHVLENFAKVLIASRLDRSSEGVKEWLGDSRKYARFCDPDFLLLKMDLYTGHIPEWIAEDDLRRFKAKFRRKIINESEDQGFSGFTGRESLNIFSDFYSVYWRKGRLINMKMVYDFFERPNSEYKDRILDDFLESLVRSYDYSVLQQVNECLYSYNQQELANNISNYIFAVNFDIGAKEKSIYTGSIIEVSDAFLRSVEDYLIGHEAGEADRLAYRQEVLEKFISVSAREMKSEKKELGQTELYKELYQKYVKNLKNNALEPFLGNDIFRNAIKEYRMKEFESYDHKVRRDVMYLIHNLQTRYNYTEIGAKEVCIYIIDKNVPTEVRAQRQSVP